MEKSALAPKRTVAFFAGLVAAYLSLNSLLNLTNKWILSSTTGYGFTFPLALTCCHMAFSFLALLPYMLGSSMRGTHRDSVQKQWRGLLAIGTLMAANVAFNNSSLVNMSLSLNQIIR
jgi:undecaprenyl pyrophosphate phosphatase UppP